MVYCKLAHFTLINSTFNFNIRLSYESLRRHTFVMRSDEFELLSHDGVTRNASISGTNGKNDR